MKKYKILTSKLTVKNEAAAEILFANPINKLKETELSKCPECEAKISERICLSCGFPNTERELDACENEFENRLKKALKIGGVKITSK